MNTPKTPDTRKSRLAKKVFYAVRHRPRDHDTAENHDRREEQHRHIEAVDAVGIVDAVAFDPFDVLDELKRRILGIEFEAKIDESTRLASDETKEISRIAFSCLAGVKRIKNRPMTGQRRIQVRIGKPMRLNPQVRAR